MQIPFQCIRNTVHQSPVQPLLDRKRRLVLSRWGRVIALCVGSSLPCLLLLEKPLGKPYKSLACLGRRTQHNLLDNLKVFCRNILVSHFGRGIYYCKIHSAFASLVDEYGMHCLADIVVAPERERQVADTAADMHIGQINMYPFHGTQEIPSVCIMFRHTRRNRQDIRVKYYVACRHSRLFRQQTVCTPRYFYAALIVSSLSLLVK